MFHECVLNQELFSHEYRKQRQQCIKNFFYYRNLNINYCDNLCCSAELITYCNEELGHSMCKIKFFLFFIIINWLFCGILFRCTAALLTAVTVHTMEINGKFICAAYIIVNKVSHIAHVHHHFSCFPSMQFGGKRSLGEICQQKKCWSSMEEVEAE